VLRALQNIRIGLFISLVNLLIQGVSFLVNNFIAKNLGTVDYGAFTVLQGDYGIFCALADFGMATLILAFFGKRASEGRLFTNVLQLRLLCSVTTMLIMLAFAFTVRRNHPAFQGELILALGLLFQHAFFDWYFICGNLWKTLLISKLLHTLSYSTVMGIALLGLKIHSIGGIALAMVLAALPAWGFGVRKAFTPKILHFTRRSFRFFALMLRNGVPYALASLASFAYLPAGLYAVDKFAPPEFLGAYSFGHKLILLASGFMVYFISSNLIVLHRETSAKDGKVHSKDIIIFTLFIAAASSPLWICPGLILKILFFAFPWTDKVLSDAATVLRILSFSLVFQAIRMDLIAHLLKAKQVWLYIAFIGSCGIINIICTFGAVPAGFPPAAIPFAALSGDICLTISLCAYFLRRRLICR